MVATLIYGVRKGALVATIGLGVFDLLNGYASVVWITILEALVVILVVHFVYEAMPKCRERLVIVGFAAALNKIVLNLFKYTLIGMLGNLTLGASLNLALVKIVGTFGSSLATVIAVPILYPIFKKISETIRK